MVEHADDIQTVLQAPSRAATDQHNGERSKGDQAKGYGRQRLTELERRSEGHYFARPARMDARTNASGSSAFPSQARMAKSSSGSVSSTQSSPMVNSSGETAPHDEKALPSALTTPP